MLALCIETSCDETSLAIIALPKSNENGIIEYLQKTVVVSDLVSSQIKVHAQYGGVVPEIGAREHAKYIHHIFTILLEITQKDYTPSENVGKLSQKDFDILKDIDKIFVTTEPGLVSALRVGHEFAKSLVFFLEKKFSKKVEIVTVNHLKGHVVSSLWQRNNSQMFTTNIFPHLHLLVSGGNTQLILLEKDLEWKVLGQTLDDAAGECLDKIGRMVGLEYPGGVHLAKIAGMNDINYLNFPVGMKNTHSLDFSYSGLKTAVRYHLQSLDFKEWSFEQKLSDQDVAKLILGNFDKNSYLEHLYKVCVSAQAVVVEQLINKVKLAKKDNPPKSIGLSGGVSANLLLRKRLDELSTSAINSEKVLFLPAAKNLTGDNAIMIGLAGVADIYLKRNKILLSGQKN